MRLVTRQQWGARPAKNRTPLNRSEQRGTAVHYSGANADELGNHALCPARVHAIQRFHQQDRGWSDIAYSYLVCKHGFVFEGRGRGIRTVANGTNSGNDGYHAVCFLGDDSVGRDDVTDAGRAALADAVRHCNAWAGVSGVRPHSSFKATSCPGDELRAWIARGLPTKPAAEPEEDDMPHSEDDLLRIFRKALTSRPGEFDTGSLFSKVADIQKDVDQNKAQLAQLTQRVEQAILQQGGSE